MTVHCSFLTDAVAGIAICSRLPDTLPAATINSEINHPKAVTEAQLIRESRVIQPGSRGVAMKVGVMPAVNL